MPNARLVYNPAAGRFPSRLLTERAAEVLRADGWQVELEQTKGGPHLTQLARQAVQDGLDYFLVAGGDGSVNFAVAGLVASQTALGVLPAGTANVWAQELGLPGLTWTRWLALEESAQRLLKAQVRQVDIGTCNQDPFFLWGGAGLDAFIVHRVEPRSRWEKHFAVAHYMSSAVRSASYWGGMDLQVMVDGEQVTSGHYLLAVISNIHLYAGGYAEISPLARLDDGIMDLWLFSGETLFETMQHAWNLWSGRHLTSSQARCIPFRQLTLASDEPMFLQVDGEPLGQQHEVDIRVKPGALYILAPEEAPRTLFGKDAG
jgi:diacylglycerol kinase (ATP)